MHDYRVVECNAAERQLTLRCSAGRYHLARPLNRLPPVGTALVGATPHLGFGILLCPSAEDIVRVIFEAIDLDDLPGSPDVWAWAPSPAAQPAAHDGARGDD